MGSLRYVILNILLNIKGILRRIPYSGLNVNNVSRFNVSKCSGIVELILERDWGIPQARKGKF